MGCQAFLQGIFPTQRLNAGLLHFLHCRQILYHWTTGKPLYVEYILWNAGLNELQAGIQIARRNNTLRYADDTTLMAESEEELKSLLMRVKEESEKSGFKLNIHGK